LPDGAALCAERYEELKLDFRNPCGACLKVCPVGKDRDLYDSHDFGKYFDEKKTLETDPNAEVYRDWVHVRSYGSTPIKSIEDTPYKGKELHRGPERG
jgi:ferredoxin